MKPIITIIYLMLSFLAAWDSAKADIIINEVMSNEPGSQRNFEWIELYNNSDSSKILTYYSLNIEGDAFVFPEQSIGAREYFVVCRKLFSSDGTAGFESYWGDADSVWGDSESENYKIYQYSGMSLKNDSGTVTLFYTSAVKSIFKWTEGGADGVSWERFTPTSSAIAESTDPKGGTPGRINSITPGQYDLALVSAIFELSNGITKCDFTVVNVGLSAVVGADLRLYHDDNRDTAVTLGDLINITNLPDFSPGDTFHILENLQFEGIYPSILVQLSPDDRSYNNMELSTVPGRDFPPIVINEFLADPESPLKTEWMELNNRSDSTINLQGWLVGDSNGLSPITAQKYLIKAGEYIVLCEDSANFRNFYSNNDIPLLEISSWVGLNNDGDVARLIDSIGYTADRFDYETAYGENFTWGRGEEAGRENSWGRSVVAGGTPGSENEVYYEAVSEKIKVITEPNPFSPRRDSEMRITFSVPPGDNLAMRVYDLQGRIIKTMLDRIPAMDGSISWNGKADDGYPLPPGIYILYLEISGAGQYKQTVVIAP